MNNPLQNMEHHTSFFPRNSRNVCKNISRFSLSYNAKNIFSMKIGNKIFYRKLQDILPDKYYVMNHYAMPC